MKKLFTSTLLLFALTALVVPQTLLGGGGGGKLLGGQGVVRRAAAGGADSPDDISGLQLWLKADALSLSDNDPVSSWTDSSGNSNHGTNTGANRPTYKTNQINSLPAVQFAISTWLDLPNFASGFTAGEIFIVVKVTADAPINGDPDPSALWTFGSDTQSTHFTYGDTIYDDFGTTARKTVGDPAPALTSFRLYNVRSAPGDWEALLDGTSLYSTGTNTVGFTTTPKLGTDFAGSINYYLEGFIAEVIMYDHGLNGGESTIVKTYIATRYGLTIA